MSPDDEQSKEFADSSRSFVTDVRSALERLKGLTATDRAEGQSAAVEALGKAVDGFVKVNADTLDLAVQNTNVKAKRLLKGDFQRQTNILAALLGKWIAGVASKPNPGAADVARLKTLDEIHAALLGMYPILSRHIETSIKEEKAAEEKKLTELQDQIQAGLATVSEGDPAGQVEGRAALAEIRSLQASIIKLSESTPPTAPPRCRSARRRPRWTSAWRGSPNSTSSSPGRPRRAATAAQPRSRPGWPGSSAARSPAS